MTSAPSTGSAFYERTLPIRDYFLSHPPLEIREAKFRAQAEAWWRRNSDQTRHVGEENLRDRVSVYRREGFGNSPEGVPGTPP